MKPPALTARLVIAMTTCGFLFSCGADSASVDFTTLEWTLVNGDAPWERRAGLHVVELDDRLYLMGGRTALEGVLPIIAEFGAYRVGRSDPGDVPASLDQDLFADIVRGATVDREAAETLIDDVLDKDRSFRRLEILMQTILRAGTYELLERDDIDQALTIHEYVAVADAFFNEREPALVNAVLDRIARRLTEEQRPGEPIHGTAQDG